MKKPAAGLRSEPLLGDPGAFFLACVGNKFKNPSVDFRAR